MQICDKNNIIHDVVGSLSTTVDEPLAVATTRCGLSVLRHDALVGISLSRSDDGSTAHAHLMPISADITCIECLTEQTKP